MTQSEVNTLNPFDILLGENRPIVQSIFGQNEIEKACYFTIYRNG